MKKRYKTFAVLILSLFVTAGVFTYTTYANQKREAALKLEAEAMAKAAADIQTAPPVQEVKVEEAAPPVQEVKTEAKPVEQTKKPEAVKKTQPKADIKTASVPRTSTISRGTTAASKTKNGVSDADRELFYRLVSAEAAGESFEGKLAIATIVMNRVKSPDYPNSIRGVIYDNNWGVQFTPVLDGRINLAPTSDSKKAVDMVLNGHRSFEAKVLYFMNPEKSTNMWIIQNRTYYKTIGSHKFYY